MPDMDGFSAIEAIRQNGYKNHIVVLTASDSETDRERAMGLGIDAYIIKTMEMSDLESKVYQLLNFSE